MSIATEKAGLTKEIKRLEELNSTYHRDGFTKFIEDELQRLRGERIGLECWKQKKDIDRLRRRKKT